MGHLEYKIGVNHSAQSNMPMPKTQNLQVLSLPLSLTSRGNSSHLLVNLLPTREVKGSIPIALKSTRLEYLYLVIFTFSREEWHFVTARSINYSSSYRNTLVFMRTVISHILAVVLNYNSAMQLAIRGHP